MKTFAIVGSVLFAFTAASGQWTAGMDDDAGKAAATSGSAHVVLPDGREKDVGEGVHIF